MAKPHPSRRPRTGVFSVLQGGGFGFDLFSAGLIALILAVVLGYWVYTDATKRGNDNAMLWALVVGILTLLTIVGGLIGLAVYVWKR